MGKRETWTTEEFGSSHAGAVGVLLDDGTVPDPVFFDSGSGVGGPPVSQWSVYDGRFTHVPRAAALCGVCSCGWNGRKHELDWNAIGERDLVEAAGSAADACTEDWYQHMSQVEESAIPLPDTVTTLLAELEGEIERLAKTSPLAALRAARRLEVLGTQAGYWPARDVWRQDLTPEQAASALGLNEDAARKLLARFGRWSPYQ